MLKDTDRVVFFGDSITERGDLPGGYVSLIREKLSANLGSHGPRVFNAGISGNKVTDLIARLDRDVISKKSTLVLIYIGINDVWHFTLPGHSGTDEETYGRGLTEIISTLKAAGARVILCTPTVIGEKRYGSNPQDLLLDEYAEISRNVARENGIGLCDLHKKFLSYLVDHNPENRAGGILTVDGVHLNPAGNSLVADIILDFLENEI